MYASTVGITVDHTLEQVTVLVTVGAATNRTVLGTEGNLVKDEAYRNVVEL